MASNDVPQLLKGDILSNTSTVERKLLSPCHNAPISVSLADGVLVGSCSVGDCDKSVVRVNRRTGLQEWLDGSSPWTRNTLRLVDDEYQNPAVLAFLPVLGLRSPCCVQPIVFQEYLWRVRVGVCPECNDIFARFNPVTNRVERVIRESEIMLPNRLPEFSEAFQPRR